MTPTVTINHALPKEPRWITTDAGRWAWHTDSTWRNSAAQAFSVQDRSQLLRDAEALWQSQRQPS